MGAESLAGQSGIHLDKARELLRLHKITYRNFWRWADANVTQVQMGEPLDTVFGWRIDYPPNCHADINDRAILNWPMQSNGAEMMRLAVYMAVHRRGVFARLPSQRLL